MIRTDLGNNYQMAIALLESNPMNPLGFWYGAKALSYSPSRPTPGGSIHVALLFTQYKKYHGSTDDWNQRIAAAATTDRSSC